MVLPLERRKMESSKQICSFLKLIDEAHQLYEENYVEVNKMDKLTQDYLHDLELGDLTYNERAKISTKLRNCRKERRKAKDIVTITKLIYDYVGEQEKAVNKLRQLLGAVRKEEKNQQSRHYIRKVDVDE